MRHSDDDDRTYTSIPSSLLSEVYLLKQLNVLHDIDLVRFFSLVLVT